MSLDPRRVWVDTSAFRQLSTQMEDRKDDASSLARRVMELYRGDFLSDEPSAVATRRTSMPLVITTRVASDRAES